ncbi:hypothetical protein [Desulfobacula phenolica]|uniref:Uncharacterized protein n=1 Tax=Desulfobacula phenolica TaxID=90732 RepID=A0A1H2JQB3_9BACT|nr:hypothetical protein [Desulfobacula phenolica]SDU58225.1 hypothetical protein SAMN04487931_1149 [Desulfobacula phenolica]
MSAYKLLFRILVKHEYYSGSPAGDLEFLPTHACEKIMNNSGLILKKEAEGISMFFDETRTEALTLYAADPFDPLLLNFKVYSKNPLFENFTGLPSFTQKNILFFNSEKALLEPILPFLTRSDKVIRPLCVISIHFGAESGSLFNSRSYYLKFPVRKTFWKYYLLGKYTKETLSIVDLDNKIIFTQKDNALIPGNRKALVFESDKPIPLTQMPLCRFQLKKQTATISRILVKRLPVASPNQTNKRMNKENKKEYVSEIFINP